MQAFVTGGTGFVGGNLIRQLLNSGIKVRALVRSSSDQRNLKDLAIDQVSGDLDNQELLEKAMQGCEWLFHVAAHYSLCLKDSQAIYKANVNGTKKILAAAHTAKIKRIVYTSSVAAIGLAPEGQIADESTTTTVDKLISDYKKSKFLAEQLAFAAAKDGIPVIIVNPSTPIGPYDVKPTPTGDIVLKFLRRQMPVYVHTGLNLVDVRDVAQGHILAAEKGRIGERYILGNKNVTLKEILDILEKITGLPAPKRSIPHFIPMLVSYFDELIISKLLGREPTVTINGAKMACHPMYYHSEKAVRELGLPQSSIETALQDAVTWFKMNGYLDKK
ncbi:MAG: NAD-dependent epimerase/dehydratase family protein [Blastocatellia bacterium]|nr:NAD-dependent epimerase/dehydratase family protein [Blastocatellia bacterium]